MFRSGYGPTRCPPLRHSPYCPYTRICANMRGMTANPWHELLMRDWVGLVLAVVNLPLAEQVDPPIHEEMQFALLDVMVGGSGAPKDLAGPEVFRLPPLGFTVWRSGRTRPWLERPNIPEL